MRAHKVAAFVVVLLILSAVASMAQGWDTPYLWDARAVQQAPTQSWFGASGMIVIPTADVIPQESVTAHFHSVELEATNEWEHVYGVNASIIQGLEFGFTGLTDGFTGTGSDEMVWQAKYAPDLQALFGLEPEIPQIAIGGRDLANDINRVYYIALSKEFIIDEYDGNSFRATVGFGDAEIGNTPLDGLFAGVDFTPFDFARLQLEHDGENFNAALRYWWSEWAVTEGGVLDGDLGAGVTLHTGW